MLAFIAPYTGVRISPATEAYASIGIEEEFGIESAIEKISPHEVEKLYLLINTPGGGMTSSYKVARALRLHFREITVFVPHVAASGGTLIALTGNRIVMGPMSNLTPLDAQISYKGTPISTNNFMKSFQRWATAFSKLSPEEAPYPLRAMAEKLDPLIMEEMNSVVGTALSYVGEILSLSGYEEETANRLSRFLVVECQHHSFVLTRELLHEQGFNVVPDSEFTEEWNVMRHWLRKYMLQGAPVHHIRYAIPEGSAKGTETSN